MKSTFKKLLPFAVVGVISGATTVGIQQYIGHDTNSADQSYFTSSKNASFVGMNTAAVGDDFVKAAKTTRREVQTELLIRIFLIISLAIRSEEEVNKSKNSNNSRLQTICLQEWVQVLLFLPTVTSFQTTT